MIDRIVKDIPNQILESKEAICERLEYFRALSQQGLHKLSEANYNRVKEEFNTFYNIHLTLNADTYPTRLFRVTNNKCLMGGKKQKLQKVTDLIGPPSGISKMGRCNLVGESVFYAALDLATAIWETQPVTGDYVTVSEWRIRKGVDLRNHFIFHPDETNLSKESRNAYEASVLELKKTNPEAAAIFIELERFICEEFMKPVDRSLNADYLFSGIVASEFLQRPPDGNGFKIESISYPSTRRDHKVTNMAITNSLVFDKLDLVSITLYDVTHTNYDINNKEVEDLISVSPLVIVPESWDIEQNQIKYNLKKELDDVVRLVAEGKLKAGN